MTAYSFVMRYVLHGMLLGQVVLIDEISFTSIDLLAALEQTRLKGARPLAFGDSRQLPRVCNRWRGQKVLHDLSERSSLLTPRATAIASCCGGAAGRIKSTSIPASGAEMFGVSVIREARSMYTPAVENCDWHIRVLPRDELIGANSTLRPIANGAFLMAIRVSPDVVALNDEDIDGEEFDVTVSQLVRHRWLRHTDTLCSVQGRTLSGTIALYDLDNRRFS
jgi:hypothetical protein